MSQAVRWRVALAVAVAVVLAVPIVSVAGAPAERKGPIGSLGWFHTDCELSHRAPDDPIVYPGRPGASHLHDFFGNRSLDANSTPESLLAHLQTTCIRDDEVRTDRVPSDRSAYWVPALYAIGPNPIEPSSVIPGYSVGPRDYAAIEPFPEDLRVIAGSAAGADPQAGSARIYLWECGGETLTPGTSARAPLCATPDLRLYINFPDCWDGADPDSSNHKSHMAYSQQQPSGARWKCPVSHPVLVPRLGLQVRYPTTGGQAVRLASGGINTAHADFMNGWAPGKLAQLVRDCLNVDKYCGGISVPAHDDRCAKAITKLARAKAKLRELRADDDAKAQEIRKAGQKVKTAKKRKREACA